MHHIRLLAIAALPLFVADAGATVDSVHASVACSVSQSFVAPEACGVRSTTIPSNGIMSQLAISQSFTSPTFPYGQIGHNAQALAQARASYGNLGVYTLGNTIAQSIGTGGITSSYAQSQAEYTDVGTIQSDGTPIGTPIPVTFGVSINRDVYAQSTIFNGFGRNLSKSSLDARMFVSLLDSLSNPVATLYSFYALACYPIPCASSGVTLDPSGIDSFQWTLNLRVGDKIAVQGYLRAESEGVFRSITLDFNSGVGYGQVQSYNSAHSFFKVESSSASLSWTSGTVYPTSPVPETSTASLLLAGGLVLRLATRLRGRSRIDA